MAQAVQIDHDQTVQVGRIKIRNTTGTPIRVELDADALTIAVTQCCIGEM